MRLKPISPTLGLALLLAFFFQNFAFAQNPSDLPVPCRKGMLYGLADPADGRILLPPSLDSVGNFQYNYEDCPFAWGKKGGLFGLINRLGEVVLPFGEQEAVNISPLAGGYFYVEKLAFGAKTAEEEAEKAGETYSAFRPIAFFDSMGRGIGRPFEFENYVNLEGGDGGDDGYDDPSGLGENTSGFYHENTLFQAIWKAGKMGLFDLKKGEAAVRPRWKSIQFYGPSLAVGRLDEGSQFDEKPEDELYIIDLRNDPERPVPFPKTVELARGFTFSEDRFLAKDRTTGRFGYLDRAGREAILFTFLEARPFSRGGLASAQRDDDLWRIIDRTGRDSLETGASKYVFRGPDGGFWTESVDDELYRRAGSPTGNPIEQFGFDELPKKTTLGGREFWLGSRNRRFGLLNPDCSVALPFKFDEIRTPQESSTSDTDPHRTYFYVSKKGRCWIFDSRTMLPIRPNVLPESGLLVAPNFEESNFGLITPLLGDSLFAIITGPNTLDVLNIRTGRRWYLPGPPNHIGSLGDPGISIYVGSANFHFSPNGRPKPPDVLHQFTPGFGRWGFFFEEKTGLTTVFDSTGRLCSLRVPFEGAGNNLSIEKNRDGTTHQFVIMASSPDRRSAVFSLAGKLLSPPYIYKATVSNDLIFAEMYQKEGVYRLSDGKEILPCAYRNAYFENGEICAIDSEGTENRFDLRGKKLFSFEKGISTWGKPSDGLQLVKQDKRFGFVDENRRPIFWLAEGLRPSPFSSGLSSVYDCGTEEQFFINKKGEKVFEGRFSYVSPFEDGLAIVRSKADEWQLIDPAGKVVLSHPGGDNAGIGRLKNGLFVKRTGELRTIVTLDGQTVLKDCSNFETRHDTLFFHCSEKFGYRLLDGTMGNLGEKYLKTIQKTPFGKIVATSVVNYGQGFRAADGHWIVEPRRYRNISAGDGPFIFVADDAGKNLHCEIIDARTGSKVPTEPFDNWDYIEGLGYILRKLLDGPAGYYEGGFATAFLYDLDFASKKAIPVNWVIDNDRKSGCFLVSEAGTGPFLGYIARNGKALFED